MTTIEILAIKLTCFVYYSSKVYRHWWAKPLDALSTTGNYIVLSERLCNGNWEMVKYE